MSLPRRMRRRLTIAFVLVAGLLTAALALATFLIVRDARLADSVSRGERETRFALQLAAGLGSGADLQQFVDGFEGRGLHAVLLEGGRRFASDPSVDPPIPGAVQRLVAEGQLAYDRLEVAGEPYLVVGGRPPGTAADLYLLFPEQSLQRDLSELWNVLVLGWVAALVVSTLVGWLVARRTLAPVAEAAQAARAMAEGLLDTRLPVESADEFGAWAASFNEMAEALEAKVRALSEAQTRERRFTSDVAHELRTPITALVSEAGLLAERLDQMTPQMRRPAELLIADVARLRRLVEDLMEISRLDAGREVVEMAPLDLAALVTSTIRSRGWRNRVTLSAEAVRVVSDRRRLERIVSNLVGNAVEHGGGHVEVAVETSPGGAVVTVADRGPGIDPADLPHLFERFYKADPARSGSGSGLGLPIALENARLLGGDIEVQSGPGAGSRFTLRLPDAPPASQPPPAAPPSEL
ncbi:MAG TPA: HAMP domain-containing sensor histidine kinase [Actinomycetota bacterium]